MLTAEQLEIRKTGIGASEIAAIAGLNPFASPIDVWLQKPTAQRPAIITEQDPFGPTEVGSVFEPVVLTLYSLKTGNPARRCQDTLRHPEHSWALASPDAYVAPEHLVEIKCVGEHMADAWHDGPPEYVYCQALWQMFVTGATVVDVTGQFSPTEFPLVWPVVRDDELIANLADIGRRFWFEHVLTDTPPPAAPDEDRREYLHKRFRQLRGDYLQPTGEVLAELLALHQQERAAVAEREKIEWTIDAAQCAIREIIGPHVGVRLPDGGRYDWKAPERGGVSYKAIAEALAPDRRIPPELLAAHTSAPSRRFAYYPPAKPKGGR